jgi:ABC transporter substrate binding protein
VIGFLNGASPKAYAQSISGFLQGLKEMGYIEGQNVTIEYRWAEGRYARLQGMAADLMRGQVSVIVANTPAAPVVKAATTNIPIVLLSGDDPVANGLVASLNRPGGNVTGISLISGVLGGKQLGVLHELIPSARSIAFLTNPTNSISTEYVTGAQEAARSLGAEIHVVSASTEAEIDKAFASLSQLRADALGRGPRCILHWPKGSDCGAGGKPRNTDDIPISRIRRRRRPDELRSQPSRPISPSWHLRGAHSQGYQTSRFAGDAANHVRTTDQPQDGEGARYCRAANASRSRRRSDRVRPAMSAIGT